MQFKGCNYHDLCRKLFNPSELGILVLQEALSETEVRGVLGELTQNKRNFVQRPEYYGTTRQVHSSWDFKRAVLANYQFLSILDKRHTELSRQIYEQIGMFRQVDETRVNASFYEAGSAGIGPHRDNSFSVNFTAIYILSGDNKFCGARDKTKDGEVQFDVLPGDVVLMRGPRNISENDIRPVHYIERIQSGRYIVIYREINHEQLHKIGRDRQYNA